MNRKDDLDKLLENINFLSYKYIAILGEGKIGKILGDYLIINNEHRFIDGGGFIVDDGYRRKKSYRGIPVWEMTEFLREKEACQYLFLNTITSVKNTEYLKILQSKGFENIINTNESDMALALAKDYWEKYFTYKDISVKENQLIIGRFVFPNPFLKSVTKDILYSFVTDTRDLVITTWLNDYSQCDDGPYESEHVQISAGDVVIDCGANIGLSTSNAIAKECRKVYSIEPVINEHLIKCKALFGDKMEVFEVAFSDYEGKTDIYINPDSNNDNSIYHITNTLKGKKEIEVTTLDRFVEKNRIEKVDFIKMYIDDVEGRMIQGARNVLMNYSPQLAIFPYCAGDIGNMINRLANMIKEINSDYKIEYNGNKMFAYV